MDLQKAPYSKRLFAFLADLILAGILIVGMYFLMSSVLDVDKYNIKYDEIKESYEMKYSVSFDTTQEEYSKMTKEEKENYINAVDAMNNDEEANNAKKTYYLVSFIIFASGIIVSMALLEFIVPLITKDGRTLGKLLFGLGVMKRNYIKVSNINVFARGVIGKGVFEIALPLLLIITCFGTQKIVALAALIALVLVLIVEIVVFVKSKTNALLHDILADTVVIDWQSQMIFENEKERDEYLEKKKNSEEERKIY